ncbi:MAG TPA: amidohydrolase, partial [Acinetobacter radioresistens]|nr:amidohydrolase [Acinetobacter radioresistens]
AILSFQKKSGATAWCDFCSCAIALSNRQFSGGYKSSRY